MPPEYQLHGTSNALQQTKIKCLTTPNLNSNHPTTIKAKHVTPIRIVTKLNNVTLQKRTTKPINDCKASVNYSTILK